MSVECLDCAIHLCVFVKCSGLKQQFTAWLCLLHVSCLLTRGKEPLQKNDRVFGSTGELEKNLDSLHWERGDEGFVSRRRVDPSNVCSPDPCGHWRLTHLRYMAAFPKIWPELRTHLVLIIWEAAVLAFLLTVVNCESQIRTASHRLQRFVRA